MPRKNKKGARQPQRRSHLARELDKIQVSQKNKKHKGGPQKKSGGQQQAKATPTSGQKAKKHAPQQGSRSAGRAQTPSKSFKKEDFKKTHVSSNRNSANLKNLPELVEGRLDIHPNGFGFVIPDGAEIPHIYIPQGDFREFMNRDRVQARIQKSFSDGKLSGSLVTVIKRHHKELIGLIRVFAGGKWVIPFDSRDRHLTFEVVENALSKDLKNNQTVLCKILEYPTKSRGKVEILELVDDVDKPHNDTLRVLLQSAWPREFSHKAVSDAEEVSQNWEQSFGKQIADLTHIPFVTIDGADARDFDDAVYAKEDNGGFQLWVAIADVSRFVKIGTRLDEEAFERSTSVYFPDHVVPMLPEVLSNGTCSLMPLEKRPSLCCHMHINAMGETTHFEFTEGVILSRRRMTYEEIEEWIEDRSTANYENDLVQSFRSLVKLTQTFLKRRKSKGGLDLDIPEARVFLNKDGTVRDIQLRGRLYAHKLIEECMLAANRAAATFLREKGVCLYRVHEQPNPRKVEELYSFLALVGVQAPEKLENTIDFSKLLEMIRKDSGLSEAMVRAVHSQILRSLAQARYSEEPLGHFALGEINYTHFTSPIRRYPDLIVHRLIRAHLSKQSDLFSEDDIAAFARHTSDCERQAVDMERKLIEIKKCRYIENHIGEVFKCSVTGVAEKGLFCQIQDHFVDGLLESEILASHKFFFDGALSYRSSHHKQITFGSEILLRVDKVDPLQGRINFGWVEDDSP